MNRDTRKDRAATNPEPGGVSAAGSVSAVHRTRVATEPRRLEILRLIWDEERSAGEIAAALPVSFAAVSQHLGKLLDAGLVEVRPDGRHRYYRARKRDMGTLAVVLESLWRDRLAALREMAERDERSAGNGRSRPTEEEQA